MELRLLTEPAYADEFDIIADELMDEYTANKLSADERAKFAGRFLLAPERQQKLRFSVALRRYAEVRPVPPPKLTWTERLRSFWGKQGWALRAATALVLVAIVIGVIKTIIPPVPPSHTFAITLSLSDSDRDEGAKTLKVSLPPGTDALKISLTLPERSAPGTSHRVELQRAEDGKPQPLKINEEEQSVSAVIPAAQLTRGRYALQLYTTKADAGEQRIGGNYFFNIE